MTINDVLKDSVEMIGGEGSNSYLVCSRNGIEGIVLADSREDAVGYAMNFCSDKYSDLNNCDFFATLSHHLDIRCLDRIH